LVIEEEFGRLLTVSARQGSTISPLVREAWDGDSLELQTKHERLTAEAAHVCIVGHITAHELKAKQADADLFNGFANRFLYVHAGRSKLLPEPQKMDRNALTQVGAHLGAAVTFAQNAGELSRTPEFRDLWHDVYSTIESQPAGGLLFDSVTARATAQLLRLTLIFALLDRSPALEPVHLEAALAVWEYCEQTAAHHWGMSFGGVCCTNG
jgi:hypothetical protein